MHNSDVCGYHACKNIHLSSPKEKLASAVKKKDGRVVCGFFQILFRKYHLKFNLFLFVFPCAVFVYERNSKNVA